MKRKFWTAMTLALALMCPAACAAADQVIDQNAADQTASTTITYSQDSSYMVTIPDTIAIGEDGTGEGRVTISANPVLPAGKSSLGVKINGGLYPSGNSSTSTRRLKEKNNEVYVRYYVSYKGGARLSVNGTTILTSNPSVTSDRSQDLVFELADKPRYSGEFEDTLTFTVYLI